MKLLYQADRSVSLIRRAASCSAVLLSSALLAWVALPGPAVAAVAEGSKPTEWAASPTKHQVLIKREATDEKQAAMIKTAEAAPVSREALQKAAGEGAVAEGDKVWWYQEQLGIRIPYAVTGDAVAYYAELVGKYGKQVLTRYTEPSSRLDYHATVKFHKEFKLDDKTFSDVHVVTLKLTFEQSFVATQTEGMSLTKERVVVLSAEGKVIHVSGDGVTEVPIMAI